MSHFAPQSQARLRPPFQHRAGFCWVANLPAEFAWPSDSSDAPVASRLRLAENDLPLAPRHAGHDAIVREGGGRYSHWNGALLFSTKDGSDPNTNGRVYGLYRGAPTPRVLAFGTCHLHGAIENLENRGLAHSLRRAPFLTFTPREALQLIDFDFARVEIPDAFHPYAAPRDAEIVLPGAASAADVVMLEFTQAIDVVCGSFLIMRRAIVHRIVRPIAALGPDETRIANRWYQHGLIQRDEAVRRETAAQLLAALPRIDVDQAVAREIVAHARGAMQSADEVTGTIKEIRERLQAKHVAIVIAPNMYMPDGRPVAFPANFPKELERVCGDLGFPLLRLADLVAGYGAKAIMPDLYHFTPPFRDVLADEVLTLSRRVLDPH